MPMPPPRAKRCRDATLLALRALGVIDARARGLVAQVRAAISCQYAAAAGTSSSGSATTLDAALARIVVHVEAELLAHLQHGGVLGQHLAVDRS